MPSHGLTGCFSANEKLILAVAWEPYQELFQGVAICIHSDFRLGGLAPGETKRIRGTIYITNAGADKAEAFYWYMGPVLMLFLPWTLFLPLVPRALWNRRGSLSRRDPLVFLLAWIAVVCLYLRYC